MRTFLIRFLKRTGTLMFVFFGLAQGVNATTFYSSVNGGLWSDPDSWSTVTYGSPINAAGTYPSKSDDVYIGNGYTIFIDRSVSCASLSIGQGASGCVEYSSSGAYTLTVAGNLSIFKGATFSYTGNKKRMHTLVCGGSIMNSGMVKFYVDKDDNVNLTFNNSVNATVSGSGTFSLNIVTLKKTLTTSLLDVTAYNFGPGMRQLILTSGIYKHNNTSTFSIDPTAATYILYGDATLEVSNGTVYLAPSTSQVELDGRIIVDGGTLYTGDINTNQGIAYDQVTSVTPGINLSSGSMTVYGGITHLGNASSAPFSFTMNGGNLLLNSGTSDAIKYLLYVNDVAGSNFTMSAGFITLERPNASPSNMPDFIICGRNGTVAVTGGEVDFGDTSTPSGSIFSFEPITGIVQPNFKVSGPAAATVTVKTSKSSVDDFSLLSLKIEANKVFDIRSLAGTKGDDKKMTLVKEMDGLNAFYNDGLFKAETGTVEFAAPEGQWISGLSTTTFYNLNINNIYGISVKAGIEVSNQLSMLNGVAYTTNSTMITLLANGFSNIGSNTAFVDGPMAKIVASTAVTTINYPIGKLISYRPIILTVQHNSVTPVTYTTSVTNSSAKAFGYTLPSTLNRVSDVRYFNVSRTNVSNLTNARISLTYGTDDVVNDYNNLRVARDDGSTGWNDLGGVGTANGSGSITSATFTSFNRFFTIANNVGGNNPLPVELIAFNAVSVSNVVHLNWTTASEINSDYFEVQSSSDGKIFIPVSKTSAAGNSSLLHKYAADDEVSGRKIIYYRLRIVDLDGTFKYSPVKIIRSSNLITLHSFPNPAPGGVFNFMLPQQISGNWKVELVDIAGREMEISSGDNSGGEMITIVPPAHIVPGMYTVLLSDTSGLIGDTKIVVTDL